MASSSFPADDLGSGGLKRLMAILCCPVCGGALLEGPSGIACQGACGTLFPLIGEIPVLINERNSVFTINDFVQGRDTYFRRESRTRRVAKRLLPSFEVDLRSSRNLARFVELVGRAHETAPVLVIGGGVLGIGMQLLASSARVDLIETDVTLGPRTRLICDAHDLPFSDSAFDGVVAQAVLEHVVDPQRVVDELWRVLKPGGYVYAETPFMQQVHGRQFDFTRYTYLGHRRLFRHFEQVSAGAVGGPALALAWSYRYFLLSLVSSSAGRAFMEAFARLTAFWLKFLDRVLVDRAASLDAASAFYFLGRKSASILSDKELIAAYNGGDNPPRSSAESGLGSL